MSKPLSNGAPEKHLAAAYQGKRHEARYAVQVEIEVSGINRMHNLFRERTLTRDISAWGCSFSLSVALRPNDIVQVCVVKGEMQENATVGQALFQVLRAERERYGWLIATWKLGEHDLWYPAIKKAQPAKHSRKLRRVKPVGRRKRARKT